MPIYVALLRGINVGGKNKIKMADLKKALERIGLGRVQTYIQSGNIVFEAEEEAAAVTGRMESLIKDEFGVAAAVFLRTAEEWKRLIADCPYAPETLGEGESLQVSLLGEAPSPQKVGFLAEVKSGNDEYRLQGRELYMLLRQSILDSKLAASTQKLGDQVTTRNWNTISKLGEMVKAMEEG